MELYSVYSLWHAKLIEVTCMGKNITDEEEENISVSSVNLQLKLVNDRPIVLTFELSTWPP